VYFSQFSFLVRVSAQRSVNHLEPVCKRSFPLSNLGEFLFQLQYRHLFDYNIVCLQFTFHFFCRNSAQLVKLPLIRVVKCYVLLLCRSVSSYRLPSRWFRFDREGLIFSYSSSLLQNILASVALNSQFCC
jgi:hypothetical protein